MFKKILISTVTLVTCIYASPIDSAINAGGSAVEKNIRAYNKQANAKGATIKNTTKMSNVKQSLKGDDNQINNGIALHGGNAEGARIKNNTKMNDVTQNITGDGNEVNNGVSF